MSKHAIIYTMLCGGYLMDDDYLVLLLGGHPTREKYIIVQRLI